MPWGHKLKAAPGTGGSVPRLEHPEPVRFDQHCSVVNGPTTGAGNAYPVGPNSRLRRSSTLGW